MGRGIPTGQANFQQFGLGAARSDSHIDSRWAADRVFISGRDRGWIHADSSGEWPRQGCSNLPDGLIDKV